MRKLRQWTLNHPLQFVSVFMLVYFTWFSLLEKYAQPVLMIHSKLDDKIPFCEYFIVPYLLWFVWIAGTFVYFYIKSRDDFYHACRYMFTGMIVCLIIYTLIPNGLNLRPEITNNNIFSRLVDMIWSVDTATNVCPSIHVFNSIAINTVIQHSNAFKQAGSCGFLHTGPCNLYVNIFPETAFSCGCILGMRTWIDFVSAVIQVSF